MKLNPKKQININYRTLEMLLNHYSINDFSFEVFREGIANTSVKIIVADKTYVLRVYQQGKKKDLEILIELKFQDFLRENLIPVPLIYKNTEKQELSHAEVFGKVWQFILMEYMDGSNLYTYPNPLLKEFAQIQAKMHTLGIEFTKKQTKQLPRIRNLQPTKEAVEIFEGYPESIKDFLIRAEKASFEVDPKLPQGYNHLDLDFGGNILIKNDHISAILDFDDLSYCACIICLGNTLWHILFTTQDWDKVHFYLREYQKIRKLTPLELRELPNMILNRCYVWGLILIGLWKDIKSAEISASLEESIIKARFS